MSWEKKRYNGVFWLYGMRGAKNPDNWCGHCSFRLLQGQQDPPRFEDEAVES